MRSKLIYLATIAAFSGVVLGPGLAATAATADHDAAITGTVLTNTGAPVGGATVQAKSTRGTVYTTTSNSRGKFVLKGLGAGTYGLKFSDRIGLYPCPETKCSSNFDRHFVTEWLGDSATLKGSEKITVGDSEKHAGVRALFDNHAHVSGPVTIDGRSATFNDHVHITSYRNDKKVGETIVNERWSEDLDRTGNWRFQVSSSSNTFDPFWITDPRDGNTTFHIDLVEKITGIRVDVTSVR